MFFFTFFANLIIFVIWQLEIVMTRIILDKKLKNNNI